MYSIFYIIFCFFFLMIRRPPRSTLCQTLFPYTTLSRSDLTRASLLLGAAAARRFGLHRVQFVETDLNRPGLKTGVFDVVYSAGVLHHTPNPRASFSRLAKLARAGGIIVVGVYNAFARLPSRARKLVARLSGFRLIPFDPILRARQTEASRREALLRDQYR